jgi:hypothetical protein
LLAWTVPPYGIPLCWRRRLFPILFWLAGFLDHARIGGLKSSAISAILIERTFKMK